MLGGRQPVLRRDGQESLQRRHVLPDVDRWADIAQQSRIQQDQEETRRQLEAWGQDHGAVAWRRQVDHNFLFSYHISVYMK